jgi:sec-independent protein translocase protein TatA
MNLGGPELLVVLAVVLLLFGSNKVPELARSLGRAKSEFEEGARTTTAPPSTSGADHPAVTVDARGVLAREHQKRPPRSTRSSPPK